MYLCINFVNIFMQNICAEMEKWVLGFFLHFSNRSNHVGKRSKFYTRKFEATKRNIGKCNV